MRRRNARAAPFVLRRTDFAIRPSPHHEHLQANTRGHGLRPIIKKAPPLFCASTNVAVPFLLHGSGLARTVLIEFFPASIDFCLELF